MEYPILIEGQQHKAAALHAVCTKITERRQGLASKLIEEALQWAERQYEFIILFAGIPKFYENFSFQSIQEHRFHLTYKCPKGSKSLAPVVFPKDNSLFLSCFYSRAPLSNCLWVKDNGTVASFNTLFATFPIYWSLYYSRSIDGMISFEIKGKTLHLFDIISKEIPSLELILDHLPIAIDEIYFYFPPDRLTNAAVPEPYLYDHGHFLVHGNWLNIEQPFTIAPLSRC